MWKDRIPVDGLMNKWNDEIAELCVCCIIPERETINHLSLKGKTAEKVQNHYCGAAGLIEQRINMKQSVRMWKNQEGNYRLREVFNIVPIVII